MAELKRIPDRSEMNEQDTWAIHDLYASDAAWEAEFDDLRALAAEAAAYKGRLGESGAALLAYFRLNDGIRVIIYSLR